uniref:Uncharacterized protein n=1 Tax=Lotus japonicus TaxID=34305 RepID=I3S4W3_LOTJA|nr:unknown [Lotus japonicus]
MLMADSSKEEFLQLIKRLTLKISNIIDSHSIGAVAGLAIAIFFTWRLLRSPGEPQPRQRKRQTTTSSNPGVSTHSNASVVPSGVRSPSGDSRAQNVVDELFQPVKPTLGQIVRQKLNEGRKVTRRLLWSDP